MAKPTTLPRWAETALSIASALIVEPSSGRKDLGWSAGQIPPNTFFNWLHWTTFKWLEWIKSVVEGATHQVAPHMMVAVAGGTLDATKWDDTAGFDVYAPLAVTSTATTQVSSARIRVQGKGGIGYTCTLVHVDMTTRSATVVDTQSSSGNTDQWVTFSFSPTTVTSPTYWYIKAASGVSGGSVYGAEYGLAHA